MGHDKVRTLIKLIVDEFNWAVPCACLHPQGSVVADSWTIWSKLENRRPRVVTAQSEFVPLLKMRICPARLPSSHVLRLYIMFDTEKLTVLRRYTHVSIVLRYR